MGRGWNSQRKGPLFFFKFNRVWPFVTIKQFMPIIDLKNDSHSIFFQCLSFCLSVVYQVIIKLVNRSDLEYQGYTSDFLVNYLIFWIIQKGLLVVNRVVQSIPLIM